MPLIVEDGTGLANAESYISVADADTYFAGRNTAWADFDATDQKEPALRKATDYMLQMYRLRWKGYRCLITQALDWPRYYAEKPDVNYGYGTYPAYYSTTEVPTEVKRACCELALRAITADLAPDLTRDDMPRAVRVGPISIDYSESKSDVPIYRAIDALLAPLLTGGGASMRLIRT